jgi:hypothetical protein
MGPGSLVKMKSIVYAKANIPNNAAESACPNLLLARMNDMNKLQGNNVYHNGRRHVDCHSYDISTYWDVASA